MTRIVRKNITYSLNQLPEIEHNSFTVNNLTGLTGSIFSRPVVNTFGIYKHYALVYGFDKFGVLWMIENNVDNVKCITFDDFLNGQSDFTVEKYVNFSSLSLLILNRAKSKTFAIYNQSDFNCEHFVHYCHTGIIHSKQVATTQAVLNVAISLFELKVSIETKDQELLNAINKTRKTLNMERNPEFQKIIADIIDKDKKKK